MQFYHADFFPLAKMERNIYLENNKRRENIHNIFAFCLKGFSSVATIACFQSDYSCTYRLYKKTCMHYYAFPRHYKREPIFNNLDTCKLVWRQNWHRMIMKEVCINNQKKMYHISTCTWCFIHFWFCRRRSKKILIN